MKFCGNCGAGLTDGARFCGGCGRQVQEAQKAKSSLGLDPAPKNVGTPGPLDAESIEAISKTLFICPMRSAEPISALLKQLGATPLAISTGNDPDEIQANAVENLRALTATKQVQYVCILGDWQAVPPFYLPNPAYEGGDSDEYCLTDAPYGIAGGISATSDSDILSYIPNMSVGRIPSGDPNLIERLLKSPLSNKSAAESLAVAVTAECWEEATDAIVGKITHPGHLFGISDSPVTNRSPEKKLLCSPSWDLHSITEVIAGHPLKPNSLILFNVHGSNEDTYWYGEGQFQGCIPAFHPSANGAFPNCVLMTEACYGGALGYNEPSMVEHFFARGGKAFVGCSVIAYGTADASLSGADIIAFNFINGLEDGMSFAEALNHSKLQVSVTDPESTDISFKTVMSFNLYGIPWQKFSSHGAQSSGSDSTSSSSAIRERLRGRLDSIRGRVTDNLSDRREDYRARVPEPLKRFIVDQALFLQQLAQFKDYAKIQKIVAGMGVDVNDCTLEKVSSKDFSGYRLRGDRQLGLGLKQTFQIVTTADGVVRKTIVSKG